MSTANFLLAKLTSRMCVHCTNLLGKTFQSNSRRPTGQCPEGSPEGGDDHPAIYSLDYTHSCFYSHALKLFLHAHARAIRKHLYHFCTSTRAPAHADEKTFPIRCFSIHFQILAPVFPNIEIVQALCDSVSIHIPTLHLKSQPVEVRCVLTPLLYQSQTPAGQN
jgi:hypothetical protein